MFVLDKQKTSRVILSRKPEMYAIKIWRVKEYVDNVRILESFTDEIAKVFNLEKKSAYNLIKNIAAYGKVIQFGEYTRDTGVTRVRKAEIVCCKWNNEMKLVFQLVKL